jgi:hypothetical protein
MRSLLRKEVEFQILGLSLTIRRIIGLAVLACLLIILGYTVSGLGGEEGDIPAVDNSSGRYVEVDKNWPLCTVFIFLSLVLIALLVIEVGG